MIDCPNCGNQLMPDSSNPTRMKCTYCNYVLDPTADMDPLPGLFAGESTNDPSYSAPLHDSSSPQPPQGAPLMPATPPVGDQGQQYAAPQGSPLVTPQVMPAKKLPKGFAITALVLGIVAILNCWIPFVNALSIILGILGLIFGILALVRIGKGIATGKGMAVAGVICSGIAIVLSIIISVLTAIFIDAYLNDYETRSEIYELLQGELDEYGDSLSGGRHHDDSHSIWDKTNVYSTDGTFSDDALWTDRSFILDGRRYVLLESTFDEFQETSGWMIDLAEAGYPNGYIVQSGEEICGIPLSKQGNEQVMFWVNVYNPGKDQCDIGKCTLSSIDVSDMEMKVDLTLSGNVGIGDKIEAATDAYGEAYTQYGSSSGTYRSLTFCTSDFDRYLEIGAGEQGQIDEIELSCFFE